MIGELFYQSNQTVESEVSYIDGPSMSSKPWEGIDSPEEGQDVSADFLSVINYGLNPFLLGELR